MWGLSRRRVKFMKKLLYFVLLAYRKKMIPVVLLVKHKLPESRKEFGDLLTPSSSEEIFLSARPENNNTSPS